jgi:hypothetical protein
MVRGYGTGKEMKKPKPTREDARKKAEQRMVKPPRDVIREATELTKPLNERFPQEDDSEDV